MHAIKRRELIYKLGDIETTNCLQCPNNSNEVRQGSNGPCESCPVFAQIQSIGKELNNLSNQRRIKKAPKDLTRSSYLHLRENGWKQEEICKHYHISHSAFHFFLISNDLGQQSDNGKKTRKNITMTAEEYYDMQNSGLNDKQIAGKIGVAPESIMRWKRRNGVGSYAEICNK